MPIVKLDKKDFNRALLTDTSSGDVPIIFSNDGLYTNIHSHAQNHYSTENKIFDSFYNKILKSSGHQSSPYKYSIKKGQFTLRKISLIHPRAQVKFASFYAEYSNVLIYLCSLSPASIRAPYKVSNSYFAKDSDKASKYKEVDIDTLENELSRKHSSSYFSYKGHNRLYKLFDSIQYVSLEKRFSSFWMLDVSNCFDSIYTHSISWAVKNKEYIKNNIDYKNQFCNEFDQLMQRSNNNETNGIPIGSEISRIFSEVIFQVIDRNIIAYISEIHGYSFGKEYVFYRYVDDFVIFSKSENLSSHVAKAISDCLGEYNLYLNESKIKKYIRPFSTEKSNIISQAKRKINELEEKIFEKQSVDGKHFIKPKKINRKNSLIKYFIGQIKYICDINSMGYVDISSYLISTFSNRIVDLVTSYEKLEKLIDDNEKLRYRDVIITICKLLFFFYTVNPLVTSSYKLAKTIIIADKFFLFSCPEFSSHFRTQVMLEIEDINFESGIDGERSGFVALEGLNVLLATSEFGIGYLIPIERLKSFFNETSEISYFSLISLLYYIRDHSVYSEVKPKIEEKILQRIGDCSGIAKSSEVAHLFLDSLSCPYLSREFRRKILNLYLSEVDNSLNLSQQEIDHALSKLQEIYWFVKWNDLDLIKLLERKGLNKAY